MSLGEENGINEQEEKRIEGCLSESYKEHLSAAKALQALRCLLQQVRSETNLPVYLPVCQHHLG